jgi:hypothetical protein
MQREAQRQHFDAQNGSTGQNPMNTKIIAKASENKQVTPKKASRPRRQRAIGREFDALFHARKNNSRALRRLQNLKIYPAVARRRAPPPCGS